MIWKTINFESGPRLKVLQNCMFSINATATEYISEKVCKLNLPAAMKLQRILILTIFFSVKSVSTIEP